MLRHIICIKNEQDTSMEEDITFRKTPIQIWSVDFVMKNKCN